MMGGGANPTGAIGQVGASLELAQQIEQGLVPEPENIFLALGSGCTTAGLILGIALARKLGIGFKQSIKNFRIHAVIIHHIFARFPFLVKLQLKQLITDTSKLIKDLGGPDVILGAMEIFSQCTVFHTKYAVNYGEMTPVAQEAKNLFDKSEWVVNPKVGRLAQKLWLCGCFTGKSGAALLDYLKQHPEKANTTIFWESKSVVQPLGTDSWEKLQKIMKNNKKVQEWVHKSGFRQEEEYKDYCNKYCHLIK